jgi:hypothetical protein
VSIPKLQKLQIVTGTLRANKMMSSAIKIAILKDESNGNVHEWMKFTIMRTVHKMQRILELKRGTNIVSRRAIIVPIAKNQVLARITLHLASLMLECSSEVLSVKLIFLKQLIAGMRIRRMTVKSR